MVETWYFTFGLEHPLSNKIQPIMGDYHTARELMFYIYGHKWAFQYPEDEAIDLIDKYNYIVLPKI